MAKKKVDGIAGQLTVPTRVYQKGNAPLYLEQTVVECELGGVTTTAGLGGTEIAIRWRDQTAIIDVVDLLKAWAAIVNPDDVTLFPE